MATHLLCLPGAVGSDRCPLLQYLLERFVEVEAVPKGAPVYQPPDDKQRGVFRLVRSALTLWLLSGNSAYVCCLSCRQAQLCSLHTSA